MLAQQPAQGADPQRQLDRFLQAVAADLRVMGVDLDPREAGGGQDAANPVGVGEGERTRRERIGGRGGRRQMLQRRPQGSPTAHREAETAKAHRG